MNNKRYSFNFLYNIEIEISSLCNRGCVYCPVSHIKRKRELFPLPLFEKIMSELAEINYSSGLAFHQYNEPLVEYGHLCECIKIAKKHNPNIRLELYTNGDLLTKERLKELKKLGINRLVITCQLDKNDTWTKEYGEEKVKNMLKKLGLHKRVLVDDNRAYMKESQLIEHIYKLKEFGYGGVKKYPFKLQINSQDFCNQGSTRMGVIAAKNEKAKESKDTKYYCYSLLHGLHISYKGIAHLCCDCCEDTDEAKKYEIGSVEEERIYDLFAKKVEYVNRYMIDENIDACKECYWNQ